MTRSPALLLLLTVSALAQSAYAADDGFRCGRYVVDRGASMHEVRKKCGEPDFVSQRTDHRTVKAKERHYSGGVMIEVGEEETFEVVVDEWTYDLGPHRFMRFVEFENARVARVATGNYGTRADN
jgi:hypothetical protein